MSCDNTLDQDWRQALLRHDLDVVLAQLSQEGVRACGC